MLLDIVKNAIMAALGAQEMLREFVEGLVEKGQLSETQGMTMLNDWTEKISGAASGINISEIMDMALGKMNLATKDDIEKLNNKIAALSQRLAVYENGRSDASK